MDDFYGSTGSGGDAYYDYGRVPVSHLMVAATYRLGVLFRGCRGVADDVFMNGFDFVKANDFETIVKRDEIFRWIRRSNMMEKAMERLDFTRRVGLGHLVGLWNKEKGIKNSNKPAPNIRPDGFQSFSAYYMTPMNLLESLSYDYVKSMWDFMGGLFSAKMIDHTRVYPLETIRVEGGLRGAAIGEVCWVPLMCYLNTCYYILKGLSQLGLRTVGIQVDQEYPTKKMVESVVENIDKMNDANIYVLGRGSNLISENQASKLGAGIKDYMDFLKQDISSAWIIPINQLFGLSVGGGLDGAGALVSKEDYLSSCISTLQANMTGDLMYIFQEVCGFPNLEELTLRWNLDLHKTKEQRLKEQMMEQQVEQQGIATKQMKLQFELVSVQTELQMEMAEVQKKMLKKDPDTFMGITDKDEENKDIPDKVEHKGDFYTPNQLKMVYDALENRYLENYKLMKILNMNLRDSQKQITETKDHIYKHKYGKSGF